MTYTLDQFNEHLFEDLSLQTDGRYYIAYSGGIDSTVLLHLMANMQRRYGFQLRALHVNHNIHADSVDWSKHCELVCEKLGVQFKAVSLTLENGSEVTARTARYEWLRSQIPSDTYLMTAHHSQDRAETLLFNLMRGAGSRGLSSLRPIRTFHGASLVRPLLGLTKIQIENYAKEYNLSWIDDPSNQQALYSRNKIRHQILPVLNEFRSDAVSNIVRAADNLEQENNLLREIAICDLVEVREHPKHPLDHSYAICYEDFVHLSKGRQSNLLRFWLRSLDLHTPSKRLLGDLLEAFVSSPGSTMLLQEDGNQFRFYRGYMYVMPVLEEELTMHTIDWSNINQPIDIYQNRVRVDATNKLKDLLEVRQSANVRLSTRPDVNNPKALQGHSLNLKKWLQDAGIPPWRRQAVPLLTICQPKSDLVLSPVDQQLHNDWVTLESTEVF